VRFLLTTQALALSFVYGTPLLARLERPRLSSPRPTPFLSASKKKNIKKEASSFELAKVQCGLNCPSRYKVD
jgi:hypothetical protein